MVVAAEKLAASLEALEILQTDGRISKGGYEGLVYSLKTGRNSGGEYSLVCFLLGVLLAIPGGAFR